MATQLRTVQKSVKTTESIPRDLTVMARAVWPPESAALRDKWVKAVMYLRTTKKGWIYDTLSQKLEYPQYILL
jgi:hypothetical protein